MNGAPEVCTKFNKQFSLFEKGGKGAGGKGTKMSGVCRLYSKSSRAVAPPIIGGMVEWWVVPFLLPKNTL